MPLYSLYLHIPFCRHRCSYCDFNTYAGLDTLIPEYVRALTLEIELLALSAQESLPVHTIFFGGGTPSLLPLAELDRILKVLRNSFDIQSEAEITLEANPGTVSPSYLKEIHSLGVNRLSLGMQSSNPVELQFLERQHDHSDVIQAVEWARRAGFDNLNLDLIFGLPYQVLDTWQTTLEKALELRPDHLALYALTLEHGTPMQQWVGKGLLPEPDPDLAADMYEYAAERLSEAGFSQYEISNWARPAAGGGLAVCRHNLQYWRNLPYFGFGAGAHGFVGGYRTVNDLSPVGYIKRCTSGRQQAFPRTPSTIEINPVERQAEIGETLMMGLRLTEEGISARTFIERFGVSLKEMFEGEIERLVNQGLLEWIAGDEERLRLTPRGRLLGNQVFMAFI
jgi:oxygen-independent coproporphyrinogen III oxidase